MPYFVYRINPPKNLTYLDEFVGYRDARTFARTARGELSAEEDAIVKVIFAANRDQAESLLKTEREPRPLGEDA